MRHLLRFLDSELHPCALTAQHNFLRTQPTTTRTAPTTVSQSVQRRTANTYGSARRQTGQLPRRPCKPSISAGNSAMNTPPHCRCPRLPRGVGHAPRAPQLARGVAQMSSRPSMLLALAGAISRRGVPLTCVYACRSRARRQCSSADAPACGGLQAVAEWAAGECVCGLCAGLGLVLLWAGGARI